MNTRTLKLQFEPGKLVRVDISIYVITENNNLHQPLDEQASLAVAARKTQEHWEGRLACQPPTIEI